MMNRPPVRRGVSWQHDFPRLYQGLSEASEI
jgi:hypothetical protein